MAQIPTIGFISNWPVYQGTSMDQYAQSLIQGINAAAREHSCNLLLGCGFSVTGKSPQHHSFWPVPGEGIDFVPVGPWNTDGLIIVPDELTDSQLHYVKDLLDSGFPVIFTTPEGPGPLVAVDNTAGIQAAFSHLFDHGRRRIAFISGNPGRGGDSEERLRAYREALSKAGLPFNPDLCAVGEHRKEGGAAAMQHILASGEPFDGLIASNDLSCIGAIEVLQQAGLKIPEDVALIGFDDILEARSITPTLTTVRHPTFSLGYQAVITLLEYIQNKVSGNKKVIVPTRLIVRESCGCRSSKLEVLETSLTKDDIVNEMAKACFGDAHSSPFEELRNHSTRILEKLLVCSQNQQIEPVMDAVDQAIQWTEARQEDPHIWQAATKVLIRHFNNLSALYPNIVQTPTALLIDRISQEISEKVQQLSTAAMVRHYQMVSQLGQLTAEMLSSMSTEQTTEILTRHLPKVGIKNAFVTIYTGNCEDPTSQSKVLICAGFSSNLNGLCFDPRAFPKSGFYSSDLPYQLTILPLTIEENLSGFVAFDAPNPEFCAALVHNLSAALRTSRLYQDALEGRKMAEEANQLKTRFLSMVSHELRTPLSIIVGLSEMSLNSKTIETKDMEQINTSAQHLARLIGDVLDLATSEAGQLRIIREPRDLAEVIRIPAKIGEELAYEKGLSWKANLPEFGPTVMGDQTRLRQITLNLISNAVKFTSAGQISLDINVSGSKVSVSISDTGIGIPQSDLEKVFDEFYRTDRVIENGISGIGLGLAITKQLVEAHEGKISVQSPGVFGCGSTFTFTLPILSSATIPPNISSVIMNPMVNVVILIGNNDTADPLSTYLQDKDIASYTINVDVEKDWLSTVIALQPKTVILISALASSHGWTISGILKNQRETGKIPVFAYSFDQSSNQGEFLALNYLQKPIQAERLSSELSRILKDENWTRTILLVDDEPHLLDMHRLMLERTGMRVVTATNGREALEKVAAEQPDLILLDLIMPELDGFAVLDALRASESTRDIPVVILTGRSLSDVDIERCNRGVARVLSKGVFTADEIFGHIETSLRRQSSLNVSTRQLIRLAAAFIHSRYSESITREDIASHLNISADYLTDCFRQEFGITPITYIRRYRIKQACELLVNSDLTITQVAMNVGFSDSAHFTHTFIREMGLTPRAFRQRSQK